MEKAAQAVLAARAQFMECGDSSPLSAGDLSPSNDQSVEKSRRAAGRGTAWPTSRQSNKSGDKSPHSKSSTLADLYDPVAMPPALARAHADLDRAVDRCYRKEAFPSDRARVEFLFQLYEQLTAPLIAAAKPKRGRATRYATQPPAPPQVQHPGPNPDQAAADAAHFYSVKEEPPPYRTK